MAQPARLAALPGYDTAPDIYETVETDDASTTLTQQTSPRSPSETDETTDEEEDDEEGYGVSRRRLYPQRARQQFEDGAGRVGSKDVDLSDRIDGKRRGYSVRRRRYGEPDEDENLEGKIARLRREVEECKAEAEKAQAEAGEEAEGGTAEDMDGLTKLLASIEAPPPSRPKSRPGTGAAKQPPKPPEPDGEGSDERTLTRVADFDSRLSALESALGLSSLEAASTGTDGVSSPLLPSLNILDQQFSALSSASSLSGLEAVRSRVQRLRSEAGAASQQTTAEAEDGDEAPPISAEDLENLQSLYQLIPTLSSLAPTVPALLTRLRSLRTLHTTASSAGSDLDEIERRQMEMESELKEWREGLETVESKIEQASEANGRNGNVVETWVKELMERVERLGRPPYHPILDGDDMCYQVFMQHACGHGEIIDANCELAEGQPFYLKQACPNYQFESKFPDSFCGKGMFYCTHAEGDGQWLDALQEGLWRCNAEIWILEGKIHAVLLKTKQFMECALSWGVPLEASKDHPVYPKLQDMLQRLENERCQKEALRDQAITTLYQVREWFARRGEAITASIVPKPAFVPSKQTLNKVPLELDGDVQPYPNPLGPCIPEAAPPMTMPVTERPEIAAPAVFLTRKENSSLDLLEGEDITIDHGHQDIGTSNTGEAQAAEVNTSGNTTCSSSTPMQPSSARKHHLAKRMLKRQFRNNRARSSRAASPEKVTPATQDSSFVRRSTRVRNNNPSYAESAGSDFSRDSSPVKSDGSPENLDGSPSLERSPEPPAKRKRQTRGNQEQDDGSGQRFRGSETLASKIGDWKRRTGNSKGAASSTSTSKQDSKTASVQDATNDPLDPVEKPRRRRSRRAKGAASGANGGQPANPGMYILDNGTFRYTNTMLGTLGRPFPDNSNTAAVVSRNIFNQYLQQSMPGGMVLSEPVQPPHPLDLQKPPEERLKPIQTQLPEPIFDDFRIPEPNAQQQAHHTGAAIATTDRGPSTDQMPQPSFSQVLPMSSQSHGYHSGYDFSSTPYASYTPQRNADEKADSVTESYERQNLPRVDISTYFDYDRMNRSFGAAHHLSPPKTPGIVVTNLDLEPKKRASTASSPPPAAKRVRLSLPGEDGGAADSAVSFSDESSSYGAGNSMAISSPAKTSFQLAHTEFMDAMKNDENAVTPAPIMAPKAIAYPRSQTVSNLENMCKDATGVEDSGGGEMGSGEQQQSWDDRLVIDGMDEIDWALLDGDDGFAAFAGL